MSKLSDKILEFLFEKAWGKIIMPIIDSLIFYYLAFTSKHPILHDPAVLFVASIVVIAATLAAINYIHNFLEKKKATKKTGTVEDGFIETYFEIELTPETCKIVNDKNVNGVTGIGSYSIFLADAEKEKKKSFTNC